MKWFFDYVTWNYCDEKQKWISKWNKSQPYESEYWANWDAMSFAENTEVTKAYCE